MINENEPCLQARNQTTREQETYCKVYTKKFSGYIRQLFINYQTVGLIFMLIFIGLLLYFTRAWEDDDKFGFYIGAGMFAFALLFYIYTIIKGLWFWKYAKYVVVTNEGIWIMWHGVFWGRTDFKGRRRFLSPNWSLYGWGEIKITDDDKVRPQSPVKTARFFDNFDYAVVKSTHLSSLFLTRFDGVQEIYFLDKADANEILEYARAQKRRKKRKKKDMEIIEDEYDKLPDDEYTEDDDE